MGWTGIADQKCLPAICGCLRLSEAESVYEQSREVALPTRASSSDTGLTPPAFSAPPGSSQALGLGLGGSPESGLSSPLSAPQLIMSSGSPSHTLGKFKLPTISGYRNKLQQLQRAKGELRKEERLQAALPLAVLGFCFDAQATRGVSAYLCPGTVPRLSAGNIGPTTRTITALHNRKCENCGSRRVWHMESRTYGDRGAHKVCEPGRETVCVGRVARESSSNFLSPPQSF